MTLHTSCPNRLRVQVDPAHVKTCIHSATRELRLQTPKLKTGQKPVNKPRRVISVHPNHSYGTADPTHEPCSTLLLSAPLLFPDSVHHRKAHTTPNHMCRQPPSVKRRIPQLHNVLHGSEEFYKVCILPEHITPSFHGNDATVHEQRCCPNRLLFHFHIM
jgi:hypothetical protein